MNSSVNAAFSFGTMPASTIACATCGRAIVSPPAISRTRSNSIGYPSSWSFSIISSPRRNRVSVSRRSSSRSASLDGSIQYARTCRLASSYSAENSIPGTTSILSPAAAAASSSPANVSWSVIATPVSPRSTARSTSSVGVNVPSERFVWAWRS